VQNVAFRWNVVPATAILKIVAAFLVCN